MSPKAHPPRPLPLPDIIIEQQLGIGDAVHLEPGIRMLLDGHVGHVHLFLRSDAVGLYDDYPGVTAYNQSADDVKIGLLQRPNTAHVVIDSTSHRTMGDKTRMEAYASVLRSAVGIASNSQVHSPAFLVTPEDLRWAEMYTKKRSDQLMVLWQVMASGGWKSVPTAKSLAVIVKLLEDDVAVIVLSRGEVLLPRHPNLRWARGLDIRQLKAVCAVVDRVVAHDSAPAWIAAAVGTETVAIFGPTDPDRYARGTAVKVLRVDTHRYCQPCEVGCGAKYCLNGIPGSVLYRAAKEGIVNTGRHSGTYSTFRSNGGFSAGTTIRCRQVSSGNIRLLAVIASMWPRGAERLTFNLLRSLSAGMYTVGLHALLKPSDPVEQETQMLPEFQALGYVSWAYRDQEGYAELPNVITKYNPDILLYMFLRAVPEACRDLTDRPVLVQVVPGEASNNTEPYFESITDAVVGVSMSVAHIAYKRGIPGELLHVIPNGVPYTPGQNRRNQWGIPEDAFVWCFLGALNADKRPNLLVESLARRRRADEYIIFAGLAHCGQGTVELAQQRQVSDKCIFLGYTPDVGSVYESSDALVVCSWSEAMPLVILEAMSHGLIVVANDVGGIPEVLAGQPFGILMNADDPVDFDRALTAARRLDRRACYVAAKRLWRGQYTAASMAAGYDALFKRHLTGW